MGTTKDSKRRIKMTSCADDLLVVASGDPDRDQLMIGAQNGWIG